MNYKCKQDPFFMIVPHLSIPNVHFIFRKLSPTAYLEIEFEIKNRLIYTDSRLTDSENKFISKNLI